MNALQSASFDNTPTFNLQNKIVTAKCLDLYDGDTGTFAINIHDTIYKFKMRLSGIDTPEMRPPKSQSDREIEKKAAKYVRNRLLQLLLQAEEEVDLKKDYSKNEIRDKLARNGRMVFLRCGKTGKFGRCLIKIFLREDDLADKSKSLNKLLIREHLAYKYHGGTKNNDFKTYFSLESSAYV